MAAAGRRARPADVVRVWDALDHCTEHHRPATRDNVQRYLRTCHDLISEEIDEALSSVLSDGLIQYSNSDGSTGLSCSDTSPISNCDEKQSSYIYTMPDHQTDVTIGDWYCGSCHLAAADTRMLVCGECGGGSFHRHCLSSDCSPADSPTSNQHTFTCPSCQLISRESVDSDTCDLNNILVYVMRRIKSALLPITAVNPVIIRPSLTEKCQSRAKYMVFRPLEITNVEDKIAKQAYRKLCEFEADIKLVAHNIIVMNSHDSQVLQAISHMLSDCLYDTREVRRCRDCYRSSNEHLISTTSSPATSLWYCVPCRPPHQLVFAKQKGYPYWPAKVMSVANGEYDVRFFGEPYDRANLPASSIKPIDTPVQSLKVKRTAAWSRAYRELQCHQQMLAQMAAAADGTLPDLTNFQHALSSPRRAPRRRLTGHPSLVPPRRRRRALSPADADKVHQSTTSRPVADTGDDKNDDDGVVEVHVRESRDAVSGDRAVHCVQEAADSPACCDVDPAREQGGVGENKVSSSSSSSALLWQPSQRQRTVAVQTPSKFLLGVGKPVCCEQACQQVVEQMRVSHEQQLAAVKQKQWCSTCQQEAIYHCCWNTAYCSTECQQVHWHKEHKKVCRRKRTN